MPGSCTGRPSTSARSTGSHATKSSIVPCSISTRPAMPRPSVETTSCTSSENARVLERDGGRVVEDADCGARACRRRART